MDNLEKLKLGCGRNYGLDKCGSKSCKIGSDRIILCRECRLEIKGYKQALEDIKEKDLVEKSKVTY